MPRGGSIETSNLRFCERAEEEVPSTARPSGGATGYATRTALSLSRRSRSGRMSRSRELLPRTGGTQTTMQEQEFATVLARARQGDPEAMARLVEEYEP